jgi:hypothetical protein
LHGLKGFNEQKGDQVVLRKKVVLIVALMLCFFNGYILAAADEVKTYTLDEAIEKVGRHVELYDVKIGYDDIYKTIVKYFPDPDGTITDNEIRSIINEISEKQNEYEEIVLNIYLFFLVALIVLLLVGTFMMSRA